MAIEHRPGGLLGRVFLWGGIALGAAFAAAVITHGFGLIGREAPTAPEVPAAIHQADRIIIPEGSPLRTRLVLAAVEAEPVNPKLLVPAVVEVDPARAAAVLAPVGGRVVELKVGLGQRVARGQALAVIESADLAQAYDDDDKAADSVELTRKKLERQEGQLKIGTASDQDVDQARSDHVQAIAEHTRTQARLKAIGAPLDAATRSGLLTVRAPFGGSITALSIAAGNMINDPTQPMMTIANLATVWVTGLVAEKDLAAVSRNEDAEVSLAAYPDRVLKGKVAFVSDVLESDSRRGKLRISFPNPGNLLKPNMFATVALIGTGQARVVVPTSALLINNDRTTVFVAVAPWTFERRTVETQMEEGASVAIRSGLSAGEQVVVKGGILLND
jgi:membrane fusion protein, heavy metal efflux system